jgi:hypothetical protein
MSSETGFGHLKQCPKCTTLIDAQSTLCGTCGYPIVDASPAAHADSTPLRGAEPATSETPEIPFTVSGEIIPAQRAGRTRQSQRVPQWSIPVLGGAAVVAVVAAVVAFGWLHAQSPDAAPAAPGPAATTAIPKPSVMPHASPATPAIVEPPPRQKWQGRRQASWASDGSKTISFELPASDDVPVWMTKVRPQLVVRCVSRTTDVFVALGSAASVEQQTGRHTVQIQIDDDPVIVQQWSDSESSHELFSPDGLLLTRVLADAHRLRFGFTPFNSAPVVVDFTVEGFEELAPLVAKTCGWRLEDDIQERNPVRVARRK